MPPTNTTTLNLHIDPAIREAVRIAVLRDHRGIAQLIELPIHRHRRQAGIGVPTRAEPLAEGNGDE